MFLFYFDVVFCFLLVLVFVSFFLKKENIKLDEKKVRKTESLGRVDYGQNILYESIFKYMKFEI